MKKRKVTAARVADACGRLLTGESRTKIQRETGVSQPVLSKLAAILKGFGLAVADPKPTGLSQAARRKLETLIRTSELPSRKIAGLVGCSAVTANRWRTRYCEDLKAAGKPIPLCACGQNLHHARLCSARIEQALRNRKPRTDPVRAEVRRLLILGGSCRDVAAATGRP